MVPADEDAMSGESETYVLVVEDDPSIRLAAVEVFEEAGYTVFEAASNSQALEAMYNMPDVHVLFIDNELHGKTRGVDLANEISKTFPEIGIILTSGGPQPDPALLPLKTVFLPKPYRAAQMISLVQQLKPEI